jgi:hypothetical protein
VNLMRTATNPVLQARWKRYFASRTVLITLSTVVLAAAAFFNWGWLVAAGIAPVILAVAPCVAMCALGLCASRMGGKSCSAQDKDKKE